MRKLLAVLLLCVVPGFALADSVPRTITVQGAGTSQAIPDRAQLTMSISARDESLDAAQDQAARVTEEVLAITDALDIPRNRIDTTGASVRPNYIYNQKSGEQELRGYIAERRITVDFHDLDKLPPVVEGAVRAGVNQVTPPSLYSSKLRDAHREALKRAAEDARDNASVLAKSLGVRVGDAVSISEGHVAVPMPYQNERLAAAPMAMDAEATYNPGDQSIRATVTVVFEIRD